MNFVSCKLTSRGTLPEVTKPTYIYRSWDGCSCTLERSDQTIMVQELCVLHTWITQHCARSKQAYMVKELCLLYTCIYKRFTE